jgi:hypothetical protein
VVVLGVALAYLAVNSGYYYWDGGAATGPRYLVPVMPFAGLALAFVWPRRGFGWWQAGLLAVSAGLSTVCAAVGMFTVHSIAHPLWDHLLPSFYDGRIRTLGGLFGLPGLYGLLPWVLLCLLAGLGLRTPLRSAPSPGAFGASNS